MAGRDRSVCTGIYGRMDVFNQAGLRLVRRDPGWVVDVVYPGSPAADTGLRRGDIVTHIDGHAADALGPDELAGRLTGPVGSRIELRMQAVGGDRPMVLSLRDLL